MTLDQIEILQFKRFEGNCLKRLFQFNVKQQNCLTH